MGPRRPAPPGRTPTCTSASRSRCCLDDRCCTWACITATTSGSEGLIPFSRTGPDGTSTRTTSTDTSPGTPRLPARRGPARSSDSSHRWRRFPGGNPLRRHHPRLGAAAPRRRTRGIPANVPIPEVITPTRKVARTTPPSAATRGTSPDPTTSSTIGRHHQRELRRRQLTGTTSPTTRSSSCRCAAEINPDRYHRATVDVCYGGADELRRTPRRRDERPLRVAARRARRCGARRRTSSSIPAATG